MTDCVTALSEFNNKTGNIYPDACGYHGTCVEADSQLTCTCDIGYTGQDCTTGTFSA